MYHFWLYSSTSEEHTASIFRVQHPSRPPSIFTSPRKSRMHTVRAFQLCRDSPRWSKERITHWKMSGGKKCGCEFGLQIFWFFKGGESGKSPWPTLPCGVLYALFYSCEISYTQGMSSCHCFHRCFLFTNGNSNVFTAVYSAAGFCQRSKSAFSLKLPHAKLCVCVAKNSKLRHHILQFVGIQIFFKWKLKNTSLKMSLSFSLRTEQSISIRNFGFSRRCGLLSSGL